MIKRLRVRIPAGAAGQFPSPASTLCADSYSVSTPPIPWSFCQKFWWQVTPKHAYTLEPTKSEWADYAAVQAECGNLSGNELTCKSSVNNRSQSSQLAEPLWTDPGLESGISGRKQISTKKHTKKAQAFNELSNILPKSSHARKTPPTFVRVKETSRKHFCTNYKTLFNRCFFLWHSD